MKDKNSLSNINFQNIIANIYAIMAVVFVIIPEWIAEFGISLENDTLDTGITYSIDNLLEEPNLMLSCMNLKELRVVASKLKIQGYSNKSRVILIKRIIRKLKYKRLIKRIKNSLSGKSLC